MQIFIGGTGRCGTNQLHRILGEHPQVWTIGETRFLVDAGGLEDLVRALTVAYTPFHADDAVSRFRTLLTERWRWRWRWRWLARIRRTWWPR